MPLPPKPPIEWTPALRGKSDQALLAIGRLDSIATFLPDISLFLYMYIRKEAVLSSMIEGAQSSLSDLLLFEVDLVPERILRELNASFNMLLLNLPILMRKESCFNALFPGFPSQKTGSSLIEKL